MKMAVQFHLNRGQRRTRFLGFHHGYHGDTLATMSVCDPDRSMHAHFAGFLPAQLHAALPTDPPSLQALEQLLGQIRQVLRRQLVRLDPALVEHGARAAQDAGQLLVELGERVVLAGLQGEQLFAGLAQGGGSGAVEGGGDLSQDLERALPGLRCSSRRSSSPS